MLSRKLKGSWVSLGLFIALASVLAWPAWAGSARTSPTTYEVEVVFSPAAAYVPTGGMTSTVGTLTATLGYTNYLPVIINYLSAEPVDTLVGLINTERLRQGLPSLQVNLILMQVAQVHSQNMMEQDFFSHTDLTGSDPCTRMASAGYAWQACGENIGAGYPTAQSVFGAWMNSAAHQANILSADFTEIGAGYAVGGRYHYYWTIDLARPK